MIFKWTRESLLILLTLLMILIGLFYYGNRFLIEPVRVTADVSSQTVNQQGQLLNQYPPSEELRNELESEYSETARFIPEGETINEIILLIESAADSNNVTVQQMTLLADNQSVENLDDRYVRSTYQIEIETDEAVNIRQMLEEMNSQDRLWNTRVLNYQQENNDTITGSFILDLYYHVSDNN
ncbi:hypothetical protein GCM10008929_14510 [Alkalibacterium psychrotolerans]